MYATPRSTSNDKNSRSLKLENPLSPSRATESGKKGLFFSSPRVMPRATFRKYHGVVDCYNPPGAQSSPGGYKDERKREEESRRGSGRSHPPPPGTGTSRACSSGVRKRRVCRKWNPGWRAFRIARRVYDLENVVARTTRSKRAFFFFEKKELFLEPECEFVIFRWRGFAQVVGWVTDDTRDLQRPVHRKKSTIFRKKSSGMEALGGKRRK